MTKPGREITGALRDFRNQVASNPAVMRLVKAGECPRCRGKRVVYKVATNVMTCRGCGVEIVVGGEGD